MEISKYKTWYTIFFDIIKLKVAIKKSLKNWSNFENWSNMIRVIFGLEMVPTTFKQTLWTPKKNIPKNEEVENNIVAVW